MSLENVIEKTQSFPGFCIYVSASVCVCLESAVSPRWYTHDSAQKDGPGQGENELNLSIPLGSIIVKVKADNVTALDLVKMSTR